MFYPLLQWEVGNSESSHFSSYSLRLVTKGYNRRLPRYPPNWMFKINDVLFKSRTSTSLWTLFRPQVGHAQTTQNSEVPKNLAIGYGVSYFLQIIRLLVWCLIFCFILALSSVVPSIHSKISSSSQSLILK